MNVIVRHYRCKSKCCSNNAASAYSFSCGTYFKFSRTHLAVVLVLLSSHKVLMFESMNFQNMQQFEASTPGPLRNAIGLVMSRNWAGFGSQTCLSCLRSY